MDESKQERAKRLNREATKRYLDKVRADPDKAEARKKYQREYHRANKPSPQEARARNIRAAYGVEPAQVKELWLAQGCACPGCGDSIPNPAEPVTRQGCHIDHCHESGRIRGILCRQCNLTLGHARDQPDTLRALASYLENSIGRA